MSVHLIRSTAAAREQRVENQVCAWHWPKQTVMDIVHRIVARYAIELFVCGMAACFASVAFLFYNDVHTLPFFERFMWQMWQRAGQATLNGLGHLTSECNAFLKWK